MLLVFILRVPLSQYGGATHSQFGGENPSPPRMEADDNRSLGEEKTHREGCPADQPRC